MFSHVASRLAGETNTLYRLRSELESRGRQITDLISGNVTQHGILFPQALLEEILIEASRTSRIYRPDSFGNKAARQAIAEYYRAAGAQVDPASIVLTPGTSIAYWYCFKLLANEGEEILCPRPSYPLFDYIADLSGVRLIAYGLEEDQDWSVLSERLDSCVSTKTRALVLISPHNPTGHVSSSSEIAGLAEFAARHHLAIICDEVFGEFLIYSPTLPRVIGSAAPLVITLNGMSKMMALPGIKLGWMAVRGRPGEVRQALQALELISDTFLPVNEIAQAATPLLLSQGQEFLKAYVREISHRWKTAEQRLARIDRCSFLPPSGGFYVTLRLKDLDEEKAAEALLREAGLLVHPGYFYDMDGHHLVFSFVQEPEVAQKALASLVETLNALGK